MNSLDENLYQDEESELGFPFFGQKKISEIVNKNQEEADKERKKDIFYIKHIKKKYKKIEIKNYRNKKKNNNDSIDIFKEKTNKSNEILNDKINDNFVNLTSSIKWNIEKKVIENNIYRKDAYYKHFKAVFGKYIKNRLNLLKDKCFPSYSKNKFSTPHYKYIGNPKEKENYYFLFFTIKDIILYGKDIIRQNRQYNNELLIKFIENNEFKCKDKLAYKELIKFLNENVEDAIVNFYDDKKEFEKINKDRKYICFDKHYKRETGISLLEKYGFITVLKNHYMPTKKNKPPVEL